jgi:hypothetical protein
MAKNKKVTKHDTSLEKKREVFVLSQVVFNGSKPKGILEKRRPLESKDNWTLEYREDNYYPVQVSLFRRAMNDYLQVLNKADIQIITDSGEMKKFLVDKKFFVQDRYYSVREWLFSYMSTERQKDPNSVLVPIVNWSFEKRFDNGFTNVDDKQNGIPYFDDSNKSPELDILRIYYDDVIETNENHFKAVVGEWVYAKDSEGKDLKKEFYLESDKENYYLTIPELNPNESTVIYNTYPYYAHMIGQTPFVAIGGVVMSETINGELVEYNVSDYYGAIAYACYMIGTMSDKQVIEARNNYPIKYKFQAKCTAHGCENGYCGFGDERTKCTVCDGSGYQKDTNPFGDFVYQMSGNFLDDSSKQMAQPINYVVPPIEALNYISANFKEYQTFVANELCVTLEQNMTNQAAESKRYDLLNKITLVTSIVEDYLRVCETILTFVELLLEGGKSTLIIKKPQTWDVKNREDILFQISNAKSNGSPNFVIKALVRELLLYDLKENKDAKSIVDYIMKKDKLITFGTSDLKDARIIYGADITQREQIIHDNGLDILLELLASGKKVENIDAEFEAEIAKYITPELNLTPNVGL